MTRTMSARKAEQIGISWDENKLGRMAASELQNRCSTAELNRQLMYAQTYLIVAPRSTAGGGSRAPSDIRVARKGLPAKSCFCGSWRRGGAHAR